MIIFQLLFETIKKFWTILGPNIEMKRKRNNLIENHIGTMNLNQTLKVSKTQSRKFWFLLIEKFILSYWEVFAIQHISLIFQQWVKVQQRIRQTLEP